MITQEIEDDDAGWGPEYFIEKIRQEITDKDTVIKSATFGPKWTETQEYSYNQDLQPDAQSAKKWIGDQKFENHYDRNIAIGKAMMNDPEIKAFRESYVPSSGNVSDLIDMHEVLHSDFMKGWESGPMPTYDNIKPIDWLLDYKTETRNLLEIERFQDNREHPKYFGPPTRSEIGIGILDTSIISKVDLS